jgi:hypothetical protein
LPKKPQQIGGIGRAADFLWRRYSVDSLRHPIFWVVEPYAKKMAFPVNGSIFLAINRFPVFLFHR